MKKRASVQTFDGPTLAEELRFRGLFQDQAGGEIEEFLSEKRTVYLGIDPTADSLHVGNLVPIMLMKHLERAGHSLVFIVGGGTGMIGDPRESGERVLLDPKTILKNKTAIGTQLSRILGGRQKILDNAAWLSKMTVIAFLRDVGKHFTVNQLLKRDIIKRRIESEDNPISYTEFSYSLLQGYDFLHLFQKYGVDMQIGGSDQWANIISGIDLVRRHVGGSAYALTTPIVTDKSTGKKFGKSEGNAVWLDPRKTSSYAFYQFWFNVSDQNVEEYTRLFTFLSREEIGAVMEAHQRAPHERIAQKRLAYEVTALIHSKQSAESAARVSSVLFGTGEFSSKDIAYIKKEVPLSHVSFGMSIVDALVSTNLAASKGEARRLIEQKGVSLNGVTVETVSRLFEKNDFSVSVGLLRKGRTVAVIMPAKKK